MNDGHVRTAVVSQAGQAVACIVLSTPLGPWLMPRLYWTVPLRMSESPASSTAIVEQRNSLPHAVPSSIYVERVSRWNPPKPIRLFLWAEQVTELAQDKPATHVYQYVWRLTLLPAKWWTEVLESIE